jgi:ubiquinone/menaquinone biosynthesis C-methylase UbiE
VGTGIGGSSRCLAQEFGCRVTGVDLTDEYCRVAAMLAERTRLSHLVSYRQGDALDLPFADETFDVVWSAHAAMNIADKPRLYGGCPACSSQPADSRSTTFSPALPVQYYSRCRGLA